MSPNKHFTYYKCVKCKESTPMLYLQRMTGRYSKGHYYVVECIKCENLWWAKK